MPASDAEVARLRRLEDAAVALLVDVTPHDGWLTERNLSDSTINFLTHAVAEAQRLGGCLLPRCAWPQPCHHGYLEYPISPNEGPPS